MGLDFLSLWGSQTVELFLESGAWLLFGFLAAGVLHCVGFTQYAQKFLVQPGLKSVISASAIGIPLPLCSCSVIPVGVALRQKGASRGATASFFISTPQVGVDSFMLTVGLFGIPFGIARVLISFITALCAGLLVDTFVQDSSSSSATSATSVSCSKSAQSSDSKSLSGFFQSLMTLIIDLRKYLIIGFLLAGLVSALVSPELINSSLAGVQGSYLAAILVGVPTYVCATSSTPLAAVLLAKGITAGAVMVFLLVGPATNIATVVALQKELGVKGVLIYLATIVGVAVSAGLLLDQFWPVLSATGGMAHEHSSHGLVDLVSAVILALLFLYSFYSSRASKTGTDSSGETKIEVAQSCCSK